MSLLQKSLNNIHKNHNQLLCEKMNHEKVQKNGEIAEYVIGLFREGDIKQIAAQFGYALKFDREAVTAIKEDLHKSIKDIGETQDSVFAIEPKVTIKGFNKPDMFDVLIEIVFSHHRGSLLIELISQTGNELYLEDISTFT